MVKKYHLFVPSVLCCVFGVYTWTAGQQDGTRELNPADKATVSAPGKTAAVELHLTIRDTGSGLMLKATKNVPAGISAFDALRQVVVVDDRRLPGVGQFVTGLCGIKAARGQFWALYVNGDFADKGISSIQLDADTEIEWKLQSRDTFAR